MAYRIRQADGDEFADEIREIEVACELPVNPYEDVTWWLAFFEDAPVAYLGLMRSYRHPAIAYLPRVGVLKTHRGNGLQLRLMRVAELFARRHGFIEIISDTTDNPPSANNFIRAGYLTYQPAEPWSLYKAIYWRKAL
jgi:GNAT superfamily N-acetyltransferase